MIQTAKNVFSGGLVMDFAPDNTSADTLTSALNATLTTFNGNEMALLNDMGNARVETAYLPEGYVPVGTCEFGDIIYIVSYNPLTNKSLIGCFPSPERNISSEELSEPKVTISNGIFVEEVKFGFGLNLIKTTSAKYVLMNKNLNPGDKYIIYTSDKGGLFNESAITDVGNTDHSYGEFPKLLKIHVISIDNSNKVDYLDSSITWYDKVGNKDYFINESSDNYENKPDIDSYRNVLLSGYSVFQSKVSGKLALLIELELIDTFSCTYNIYKKDKEILNSESIEEYLNYDVYFNVSWKTSNENINPSGFCLYKLSWSGVNPEFAGKSIFWKKEGNKYKLDKDNPNNSNTLSVSLGVTSVEEAYSWSDCYKAELSRCYKQESNISYDEFKMSKSYNKVLEKCLLYIKCSLYLLLLGTISGNFETNGSLQIGKSGRELKEDWMSLDTSELSLNSVVANRNKGIPIESQYYVNAHFIHDNSLYTAYKEKDIKIYPYKIKDDIINNYFRYPISKKFGTIKIPTKLIFTESTGEQTSLIPDISNLVYNYEVAPVMPYGIIPHLISKGTINFSKIGSGEINLTKWKYYNTANTSTLTVGFDIFPEENMGVAGITMEFMDNLGVAATYEFDKNSSYSGTFTDQIPFNNSFANYRFKLGGVHAGLQDNNGEVYLPDAPEATKAIPSLSATGCKVINNGQLLNWNGAITRHVNDYGTIYPNFLYLVKITVKYCYKNALGQYDDSDSNNFKEFYRWYWTNDIYNDNFYSYDDFNTLPFELSLDIAAEYNTTNYNFKEKDYQSKSQSIEKATDNVGTIVQTIDTDINTKLNLGLLDTHNTFSINENIKPNIGITAYIGKSGIVSPSTGVTSANGKYNFDDDLLHPERVPSKEENPTELLKEEFNSEICSKLYNWHLLSNPNSQQSTETMDYIDYLLNVVTLTNPLKIDILNFSATFKYELANFNNYIRIFKIANLTLPIFRPLVYNQSTAEYYGISFSLNKRGPAIETILNVGAFDYAKGDPGAECTFLSHTYNSISDTYDLVEAEPNEVNHYTTFDILNFFADKNNNDRKFIPSNRGFFALRFFDVRHYNHETVGLLMGGTKNFRKTISGLGLLVSFYSKYLNLYADSRQPGYYTAWFGKDSHLNMWINNTNYIRLISYPEEFNLAPVLYAFHIKNLGLYVMNSMEYSKGFGYLADDSLELGQRMAKKLLSILSQLWVKSLQSSDLLLNVLDNMIYLTQHENLYYYDILYKTSLNLSNNNYLNIRGIKYKNYLDAVISLNKLNKINLSNVNVELKNILKNCPILFLIKSSQPSLLDMSNKIPNAVFKIIGSKELIPVAIPEILENLLYVYLNDSYQPYYGGFLNVKEIKSALLDEENNNIIIEYSKRIFPINLNQGFQYTADAGLIPKPNNDSKMNLLISCIPPGWNKNDHYKIDKFEGISFENMYSNIELVSYDTCFTKSPLDFSTI